MRALTLTEPFATLIALGEKRIETRDWAPDYLGPLAIHAAKGFTAEDLEYALSHPRILETLRRHQIHELRELPFGKVLAVGRLAAVERTELAIRGRYVTSGERAFGDFSAGRYAWHFRDVLALPRPIPARGQLGLWDWHDPQVVLWLSEAGWPSQQGGMNGER